MMQSTMEFNKYCLNINTIPDNIPKRRRYWLTSAGNYLYERRINNNDQMDKNDAINDIGVDHPYTQAYVGVRYSRDPVIRAAVMARAGGVCEYCSNPGFICTNRSKRNCARPPRPAPLLRLAYTFQSTMRPMGSIWGGACRKGRVGRRRPPCQPGCPFTSRCSRSKVRSRCPTDRSACSVSERYAAQLPSDPVAVPRCAATTASSSRPA